MSTEGNLVGSPISRPPIMFSHALDILGAKHQLLGLSTPQTAVLQIVVEATPKDTGTDRIARALNALIEDQKNDPTTH
jgi:hypothetical protein